MERLCCNKNCAAGPEGTRAVLPEDRKDYRCRACLNARAKKQTADNPEGKRLRQLNWQRKNRSKCWEFSKDYYSKNKEKVAENSRQRKLSNPDKVKEYNHRRRARKLGRVVSAADLRAVVERAGGLCQLCGVLIPEGLRHIDHIVPLSKGGPHAQENLQLLCRTCNCRKGANMPEEVNRG